MGVIGRRTRLFENLIRLRRAQRRAPRDRDLQAVQADLEAELGETISRRLAARLLGVSHTALARWIEAGDLPVVYGVSGREEVPVAAVLDLYEAVETERRRGRRHVLEPTMSRGRERARRLRPRATVPGDSGDESPHGRADRRSLAYHRALARQLRRPMIDDALRRVWKWRDQGKLDPRYAAQWEEILRRPVPEVRRAISEDTPVARDLRQNSPFAGMLSEPERRRIVEQIR